MKDSDVTPSESGEARPSSWTFLTNHSHVLLCLAQDPTMRLRDVANRVGITERAAQRIVADLESGGVLIRTKAGRRNHYAINGDMPLRHPVEKGCLLRDLIMGVLKILPDSVRLQPAETADIAKTERLIRKKRKIKREIRPK